MAYRRTAATQARLDAVRDRIVAETVRLVATGGWGAVSVAAVARAADVATGSVYRHVDGKEDLCAEAFRRAASHELATVSEVSAHPGTAPERVGAALRTFADRALRGRRLAYALLAEPAGAAVERERLAYRRGYRALFRDLLVDGIAAGELAPHDPEVLAAILTGAMGEALVAPLAPAHAAGGSAARSAVVDELVTTCLRALPVPAPT
jgi:AcrR family transcriptional regulator